MADNKHFHKDANTGKDAGANKSTAPVRPISQPATPSGGDASYTPAGSPKSAPSAQPDWRK